MSCRICKDRLPFMEYEFEGNWMRATIENGEMLVSITPNDDYPEYFKMVLHEMSNYCEINFCPFCGEKLIDGELINRVYWTDIFEEVKNEMSGEKESR